VRDDVAAQGEREGRVHVRDVQHHPAVDTQTHHETYMLSVDQTSTPV
jgi:hypothetical protein